MDKAQIIDIISKHINTRGGAPKDWYVGVGQHAEIRLFINHAVDKKSDKWIYMPANSDQEAREIEDYFIHRMGTDGGSGGEDNGAKMVYAYKKAPHTKP